MRYVYYLPLLDALMTSDMQVSAGWEFGDVVDFPLMNLETKLYRIYEAIYLGEV